MKLLAEAERTLAQSFSDLTYANPFLPQRIQHERDILGGEFIHSDQVWSARADADSERPNIAALSAKAESLAESIRARLLENQKATPSELDLYRDLVFYILYQHTRHKLNDHVIAASHSAAARKIDFYRQYLARLEYFFHLPDQKLQPRYDPAHLFASFFQIRRAFHFIFRYIVGGSMPAAQLRAAVWHSIFTSDFRRYLRVLYNHMSDFTTLIVGPSGTGKELVARAIALSRYIPFDPKTASFAEDFTASFHPLNLSALSPTLIESELFGHKRGAFTGALADRAGWLEVCKPLGTVFLDEIGELDAAIQVKLLRVLQSRTFQRLGDTQDRHFTGKIIAATNRNLAEQMALGQFREDFYYRLCSDVITTPSLAQILRQAPDELHHMILFVAHRITSGTDIPVRHPSEKNRDGASFSPRTEKNGAEKTGDAASFSPLTPTANLSNDEAEKLTREVEFFIHHHLPRDYAWPGNFRELEQCVRNILIRQEYHPAQLPNQSAGQSLAQAVTAATLTADQLLTRYCTLVHSQTRNYEETARRLHLDRRTVKSKIDPQLLDELS